MLVKSNPERERKIVEEIVDNNSELMSQHELFVEEMRFKQMLINARKEKALTQKEISAKSGLSQQAVSRLETGKGGTIDTVIKYLHAMGLSLIVVED